MSTKVLRCPWCQTTNLVKKLELRHGRCRSCGRDVQWGLDYVKQRQAERRKAKTKKERDALRKEERSRPEFKVRQATLRLQRQIRSAERSVDRAWEKVTVAVEERDETGLVSGAKLLRRAIRTLASRKRRALIPTPAAVVEAAERLVILPQKEDA